MLRVGHVFGVVNDRVRALSERQGNVEGARLGSRNASRRDQNLNEARQIYTRERLSRFAVIGLYDEFDVELGRGIVERGQTGDETFERAPIAVERNDDGV